MTQFFLDTIPIFLYLDCCRFQNNTKIIPNSPFHKGESLFVISPSLLIQMHFIKNVCFLLNFMEIKTKFHAFVGRQTHSYAQHVHRHVIIHP